MVALTETYKTVRAIIAKQCAAYGVTDRNMIDHAVSIHFEEQVLKGRVLKYPAQVCKYAVRAALFGRKRGVHSKDRLFRVNCIQFDTKLDYEAPCAVIREMKKDYLSDLLTEHPEGNRIVYKILTGKTYKNTILELEKITGRRWIYDRAEKLHYVWKVLHR